MSRKNGIGRHLKKFPQKIWSFFKTQIAKLGTVRFWKQAGLGLVIAMATIGTWVSLKAVSFTKPAIESVEKPVVRAWKAFNDDSYVCSPKKTYKKKSYKKSKYSKKYTKKKYKKRSKKYSKKPKRRSNKVVSRSY